MTVKDDEFQQIGDCVWNLAETQDLIQIDNQGKPRLYCTKEWLLEAYNHCLKQLNRSIS
jgi:hypothetical protein